jgi:hypothetical protein
MAQLDWKGEEEKKRKKSKRNEREKEKKKPNQATVRLNGPI